MANCMTRSNVWLRTGLVLLMLTGWAVATAEGAKRSKQAKHSAGDDNVLRFMPDQCRMIGSMNVAGF